MATDEVKKDASHAPASRGEPPTPPGRAEQDSQPTSELNIADTRGAIGGRFDLLAEIGRGGMGIVYRAHDRETNETVALKVLKPEIAQRPDLIERFKSELRLARKITHKNVCRTYDLHRFGETVVIAMEFVEGESLRAFLARFGDAPLGRGQEWAKQICSGLAEAHAQGVVHRDLKPENIIIDKQGVAKVMDFGIARSVEAEETSSGLVVGTPAYMSPEQAEGKPADARSDVYSLGLLLYEMFTGRVALSAETPLALAHKQIYETPPPPREVEPDLPARLDRAIAKCLEKNPAKRFQSVTELEAALTEKAETKVQLTEGAEVELPVHLTRWQRSDWLLVLAAIAGLALFFPFFNRSSIAPRSQVTFDRGELRRICEEYAQRLGAPHEGNPRMELWWVGRGLDYIAHTSGARPALQLTNNPVPYWVWSMIWDNGTRVNVDHRGSLVSFSRFHPFGADIPSLSPEEAKPAAEKILRDFLGTDPSRLSLVTASETVWNDRRAASFEWSEPKNYLGLKHRYRIFMVGNQAAALSDDYVVTGYYSDPIEDFSVWKIVPAMVLGIVMMGLGYSRRRQVKLWARWHIAFVIFCVFMGLYTGVLVVGSSGAAASGVVMMTVLAGMAFGFFALYFIFAFESSLRRVWPHKLASFSWLFDRRVFSEPCGLAILRGTFIGLGLLGLDALWVYVGTTRLGMRLDPVTLAMEPPRSAMIGTGWSVAFVSAKELFQGLAVALILSFLTAFFTSLARLRWLALIIAVVLGAVSIPWPNYNMAAVQPYSGKLLILTLEYLLLACALSRFDVLTVAWADFTFAFTWATYYLLVMFEPTGALEEWIGFALFGLFVLAAGAVAFKTPLRAAHRRLRLVLE